MSEIETYLPGIMLAYSAFVLATLSPGPALLATMGTSMAVGRSAGILFGLGVVTGSFCWGVLTAFGLSAVLAAYANALAVIKIAGGLYLLWLACKAFRSAASTHAVLARTRGMSPRSPAGQFLRGLAVHMTNPKAVLAWIAIISLGLRQDSPIWVAVAIIAGTSAFATLFYCLCAVAFSSAALVHAYGKARRWIEGLLGAFFAFAGFKLLIARW
jgi:amino acid exporter